MTFNLGFDAEQRPVVVYHRYDPRGNSQAFIARPAPDGRAWNVQQLSAWDFRWAFSGGGSIVAEVKLGPPRAEHDKTIVVDFWTQRAGAGGWRLKGDTLEPIEQLAAAPSLLPPALRKVRSTTPGMEVQTVTSRADGRRWVLRWETLGRNRDKPRETAPPPTELRLYELPDIVTSTATHVGS